MDTNLDQADGYRGSDEEFLISVGFTDYDRKQLKDFGWKDNRSVSCVVWEGHLRQSALDEMEVENTSPKLPTCGSFRRFVNNIRYFLWEWNYYFGKRGWRWK